MLDTPVTTHFWCHREHCSISAFSPSEPTCPNTSNQKEMAQGRKPSHATIKHGYFLIGSRFPLHCFLDGHRFLISTPPLHCHSPLMNLLWLSSVSEVMDEVPFLGFNNLCNLFTPSQAQLQGLLFIPVRPAPSLSHTCLAFSVLCLPASSSNNHIFMHSFILWKQLSINQLLCTMHSSRSWWQSSA